MVSFERLEVVRGRRFGVKREERLCLVCGMGEVEDEDHFVDGCVRIHSERMRMWEEVFEVLNGYRRSEVERMSREERVDWVLGSEFECGQWKWEGLQKRIIVGLNRMWRCRNRSGLCDGQ